jgi:predicted methyltransferase
MKSLTIGAVLALVLAGGAMAETNALPTIPPYIQAAIADPARPPDQVQRDINRKPGEVIAFAGLKPGDRIADFISGSGYFTRIFSRAVGPSGQVYAFTPTEEIKNCSPAETAGTRALAGDPAYANVKLLTGPLNNFSVPEPLDMVWTAQNFHDLYDPFFGPANIALVTGAIFHALKPGGIFIVIDHVAEPGSGVRDTNTLHRIDPEIIKRAVEAAGFTLESESDVLRNPADQHILRVFDPAIRGRTDQVLLKFRKPV